MKAHSSIRLFKNPVLESLTHVHPSVPFVIWVPIIGYQIMQALHEDGGVTATLGLAVILGLLFWTITEYTLHRYLFHFNAKSKAGQYLVYLFHGIHHEDAQDPTRLVFPPVASLPLGFAFFYAFLAIFGASFGRPFFVGFISGYLAYDYIHFAVHHFHPKTAVGRALKENHMKHHYVEKPGKWGVSSPLWDHVFNSFHVQ